MPHVCGDEPLLVCHSMVSPWVCPTYVGMNRTQTLRLTVWVSMPHVCGDEPTGGYIAGQETMYAPRMWG